MRDVSLTTIKGGLNRLRTKGAALEDSLYDLLNGYVTTEKTVRQRPGTTLDHTLPAGTIGLVGFEGKFHVFSSAFVFGIDPDVFVQHVLRAPDGEALSKIHFAKPFMGALYVAAEFADGDIYHYWLASVEPWQAETVYSANAAVRPTSDNAYTYRATRLGAPYPVWTPGTPKIIGDRVEPTTYNGLYFEVISIIGANPRTGAIEPNFDVEVGEAVTESADGTLGAPNPTPNPRPTPSEPDGITRDRYRWERDAQ